MATLVLVGCGGGEGGDSCDGFLAGLSIACADWSDIGPSVDPNVQAQVEEFYNSLKQKSPFFNQTVVQTTDKYESLTGIYQSDHQFTENFSIAQFYAISPKGYVVEEHSYVGNLFSEPNDYLSMIFLPSSFWEISITRTAGGEILEHARTSASFGGFYGPIINTYDVQITYVSAGLAPESPYSSNDPVGNGPDGSLGNADDVTIKDLYEVIGLTFVRPPLVSEAPAEQWGTASGRDLNRVGTNRYFRKFTWENADAWCKSFNGRLATEAEVETHIAPISGTTDGIWETQLNWPQQSSHYWTGSVAVDDPGDGSRHKAWITYDTSNGNSVHQVQGRANTNPFWPMCVLENQASDNQIWGGFDFLNGHDIDLYSNVLGTPLRPGIYWSPVEYLRDDQNFIVESVLMLELSQNGVVTAIEDEFEDELAGGVNGTCKINGTIDGPPDNLTLDTNSVLDASLVFESCYYSDSNSSEKTILYPDGSYVSGVAYSLSDKAMIKTVLIPFDDLAYDVLYTPYSFPGTERGFKLVSGFTSETSEQIKIESVAPYFFELCNPDGTLSLQILQDAGYVCQYDPSEEMLVPFIR